MSRCSWSDLLPVPIADILVLIASSLCMRFSFVSSSALAPSTHAAGSDLRFRAREVSTKSCMPVTQSMYVSTDDETILHRNQGSMDTTRVRHDHDIKLRFRNVMDYLKRS